MAIGKPPSPDVIKLREQVAELERRLGREAGDV